MALKKTTKTEWGIDVKDAYIRVENVLLSSKNKIGFHTRFYSASEKFPFFKEEVLNADYSLDGENPIKQAYLHLKTLPEFSDATDC